MDHYYSTTSQATITVHVTYVPTGECQDLTLPHSSTKEALVKEFLESFQDANVSIDQLTFMWRDPQGNFVELTDDQVLKNGDKVKTVILLKLNPPHPINDDAEYYLWSLTSRINDGLLKKGVKINDPTSNKIRYKVKCDGKNDDPLDTIHFKARDIYKSGTQLVIFKLPSSAPKKVLALKEQGENNDIILEEIDEDMKSSSIPNEFKFEPLQSFSYTQFVWDDPGGRKDVFINASADGSVTMTKGGQHGYPKPSTLFIAVQIL